MDVSPKASGLRGLIKKSLPARYREVKPPGGERFLQLPSPSVVSQNWRVFGARPIPSSETVDFRVVWFVNRTSLKPKTLCWVEQ